MSKLVFGENGQVRFNSEEELRTAVDYILNSKKHIIGILQSLLSDAI